MGLKFDWNANTGTITVAVMGSNRKAVTGLFSEIGEPESLRHSGGEVQFAIAAPKLDLPMYVAEMDRSPAGHVQRSMRVVVMVMTAEAGTSVAKQVLHQASSILVLGSSEIDSGGKPAQTISGCTTTAELREGIRQMAHQALVLDGLLEQNK